MPSINDLPTALQQIVQLETVVLLLNEYKGVPICHNAAIEHLRNDALTLRIHPHQAVCLALERETVVQSRLFSLALSARVAHLAVRHGAVTLTEFAFTPYVTESRREIRIKPLTPIPAVVQHELGPLAGEIINLSVKSLGIYLPLAPSGVDPQRVFQPDAQLEVRFQLPGAAQPVSLRGALAYVRPQAGACWLGFNLSNDLRARPALSAFIAERQAAIQPELEALHASLSEAE